VLVLKLINTVVINFILTPTPHSPKEKKVCCRDIQIEMHLALLLHLKSWTVAAMWTGVLFYYKNTSWVDNLDLFGLKID
jgi:hypothetical protein